jgi:hypothetical protein
MKYHAWYLKYTVKSLDFLNLLKVRTRELSIETSFSYNQIEKNF